MQILWKNSVFLFESFLLPSSKVTPGLCFLVYLLTPFQPMDLNDITSVIFTQWICLVTYTYLSGVPLSSHPITSGRFGWPNMGSLWSLSFHPFVSLGMSAILRATGGQSLCLQLLLLHMASMELPFYPPVLGIIQVEDLACGKAYSLYLISQEAKPYCILHTCRGTCSLVKAQA